MAPVFLGELSKKQAVGLVYVAISVLMVALAVQGTQAQVQWFASAGNIRPDVAQVHFGFNLPLTSGFVLVNASVENPSNSKDLTVSYVEYLVFVNSTTQPFSVQGSSQVAGADAGFGETIPAGGRLNLSANLTILPDLVGELYRFLNSHQQDARFYVRVAITLPSVFGPFSPEYCYETPSQPLASCPATRTSTARGGGG